jgi:hypothetical protein
VARFVEGSPERVSGKCCNCDEGGKDELRATLMTEPISVIFEPNRRRFGFCLSECRDGIRTIPLRAAKADFSDCTTKSPTFPHLPPTTLCGFPVAFRSPVHPP